MIVVIWCDVAEDDDGDVHGVAHDVVDLGVHRLHGIGVVATADDTRAAARHVDQPGAQRVAAAVREKLVRGQLLRDVEGGGRRRRAGSQVDFERRRRSYRRLGHCAKLMQRTADERRLATARGAQHADAHVSKPWVLPVLQGHGGSAVVHVVRNSGCGSAVRDAGAALGGGSASQGCRSAHEALGAITPNAAHHATVNAFGAWEVTHLGRVPARPAPAVVDARLRRGLSATR
mmetsp:Transcript_22139/g.77592  ORF Transcript_22139/g.77592 Transcript_22139/m.77592 type:complete len:232 (-) Transcript_22139:178-873(-)